MECVRCGNKDPAYFYQGSKGFYCRKCVKFKRILLDEDLNEKDYEISLGSEEYSFDYELTPFQKQASKEVLETIKEKDCLLNAVCGAGKESRNNELV